MWIVNFGIQQKLWGVGRSMHLVSVFAVLFSTANEWLNIALQGEFRPVCRCLNRCQKSDSTQPMVPVWSPWQHVARPVANHVTYHFALEGARDACDAHRQDDCKHNNNNNNATW